MPFRSEDVARYYDENTPRFLSLGQGGYEGVIHRPVWGGGVASLEEAVHFVHQRLLTELEEMKLDSPRVLDLGCGVGASLGFLAARRRVSVVGVTNSKVQADLARARGFEVAVLDFCADSLPGPVDLAYGIESFVQASDPEAFFANVARSLGTSGRLALCDDFLGRAPSQEEERWLEEFRRGWHLSSLVPPATADEMASRQGLELLRDEDLTPFLELDRPRDRLLHLYIELRRPLGGSSKRFLSLSGGNALRQCLRRGLVTYRFRVWRRSSDSL